MASKPPRLLGLWTFVYQGRTGTDPVSETFFRMPADGQGPRAIHITEQQNKFTESACPTRCLHCPAIHYKTADLRLTFYS
jgi:hypothetical protein